MKSVIYFLVLILVNAMSVYGQERTYVEQQDSLFQHLNKELLPYPNLYDRVFPFANLDDYNSLEDTISIGFFQQAFSELDRCQYSFGSEPGAFDHSHFEDYLNSCNALSNLLPIFIANMGISWIDTNAYKDDRLAMNPMDSLPIQGKNESSPYFSKRVEIACLGAFENRLKADVPYSLQIIQPALLKDALANVITSIMISDENTNETWEVLNDGSSTSFSLSGSPGEQKILHISVFGEGRNVLWSNIQSVILTSSISDQDYINAQPCMKYVGNVHSYIPYQGADETAPQDGIGEYVVFYAPNNCGTKKITKPIIISDAWDPQDARAAFRQYPPNQQSTIYNDLYHDRLVYTKQGVQKNLVDELNAKGYDVVIVNYTKYAYAYDTVIVMPPTIGLIPHWIDGGTDYIERNAYV